MNAPTCFRCGRKASDIEEYQVQVMGEAAVYDDKMQFIRYEEPMQSPDEWVIDNEGTYNAETNHFCCTNCYMQIGMPSSPEGWKAP